MNKCHTLTEAGYSNCHLPYTGMPILILVIMGLALLAMGAIGFWLARDKKNGWPPVKQR